MGSIRVTQTPSGHKTRPPPRSVPGRPCPRTAGPRSWPLLPGSSCSGHCVRRPNGCGYREFAPTDCRRPCVICWSPRLPDSNLPPTFQPTASPWGALSFLRPGQLGEAESQGTGRQARSAGTSLSTACPRPVHACLRSTSRPIEGRQSSYHTSVPGSEGHILAISERVTHVREGSSRLTCAARRLQQAPSHGRHVDASDTGRYVPCDYPHRGPRESRQ